MLEYHITQDLCSCCKQYESVGGKVVILLRFLSPPRSSLSPKLRNQVWPLENRQRIQVLRKFTEPLFSQQLHHAQRAHGLISYLQ